jgi:hypothetical protein
MEAFSLLLDGFAVALRPLNLALVFGGVLVGTTVGMLPGIGPINAIAVLLPILFATGVPPESGIILLAGIYYGSQYGNSISTILLNIPGTASSVVTAIDGYEATKQGRGGPALAVSAVASFVGGTLSVLGLVLLAPVAGPVGHPLRAGGVFRPDGLRLRRPLVPLGKTVSKGMASAAVGLLMASVGLDPNSAVPRFTFGQLRLFDGVDFVVVTLGLFAVSEVLHLLAETEPGKEVRTTVGRVMITGKELAATAGRWCGGPSWDSSPACCRGPGDHRHLPGLLHGAAGLGPGGDLRKGGPPGDRRSGIGQQRRRHGGSHPPPHPGDPGERDHGGAPRGPPGDERHPGPPPPGTEPGDLLGAGGLHVPGECLPPRPQSPPGGVLRPDPGPSPGGCSSPRWRP